MSATIYRAPLFFLDTGKPFQIKHVPDLLPNKKIPFLEKYKKKHQKCENKKGVNAGKSENKTSTKKGYYVIFL